MRGKRWMLLTFAIILVLHNVFDLGKWAIGRYTDIGALLSVAIMLAFSLVFTMAMEVIHRWRSSRERRFVQYVHHGVKVWVRLDLKGHHWDPTLCKDCRLYRPDTDQNCPIAQRTFELCKECNLVLALWECPVFEAR